MCFVFFMSISGQNQIMKDSFSANQASGRLAKKTIKHDNPCLQPLKFILDLENMSGNFRSPYVTFKSAPKYLK